MLNWTIIVSCALLQLAAPAAAQQPQIDLSPPSADVQGLWQISPGGKSTAGASDIWLVNNLSGKVYYCFALVVRAQCTEAEFLSAKDAARAMQELQAGKQKPPH